MKLSDLVGISRARRWIRTRWRKGLRVLLEGAAVLGALLVFASAGIFILERATATWFWRGGEYDKLTSLRAGFDLRYFEDQLGPPFTSRVSGGYRESGFKGRDYWVQTISRDGIVQLYAVTSCDRSFHPTFTLAGTNVEIELNRDHFTDVIPGADLPFDYSIGVTAPSLFYEAAYGGMSSFYKTTLWGVSSLCGPPDHLGDLGRIHSGDTSELDQGGQAFRRLEVVNTFAESAPGVGGPPPSRFGINSGQRGKSVVQLYRFGDFYIGPDQVLLQGENW